MKFIPAILPEHTKSTPALLFLFCEDQLVLTEPRAVPQLSSDNALFKEGVYLGTYDEQPAYTARLQKDTELTSPYKLTKIRPLHSEFPPELYALIGYASQILTWSENHQFCSKCGAKAEPSLTERMMVCTRCGFMNYPRISPSMIVAITRGRELLMARGHHFPEGLYSVVAGFLEPGENMEQCVAREVMEETGLEICNIRYHSSQPWPFPHSIMIGFTADYAGGELRIDHHELADAGWYTPEKMPTIPPESTIARKLIEEYLQKHAR